MNIEKLVNKTGLVPILKLLLSENRCSYTRIKETCKLNPQTLSRRLKELQELNLIKRNVKKDRGVEYNLTERGKKVIISLQELDQLFSMNESKATVLS